MVETGGLENRLRGDSHGGSNPSSSAIVSRGEMGRPFRGLLDQRQALARAAQSEGDATLGRYMLDMRHNPRKPKHRCDRDGEQRPTPREHGDSYSDVLTRDDDLATNSSSHVPRASRRPEEPSEAPLDATDTR